MFLPDPPPPRTPVGLKLPVAIIGAGVTGLSAAYGLTREKVAVRVFEASERSGGVIQSVRTPDGWLFERGPNSFQLNSSRVEKVLNDLGLGEEITSASPLAKHRYVVKGRRLVSVPESPGTFLRSRLLSPTGKLRLFKDVFMRPRERQGDLSLSEFIEDHFGREAVRFALDPFVSGIYAGDPSLLSARYSFPTLWELEQKHGSLLRGMGAAAKVRKAAGVKKTRIISFPEGLETLPKALTASLPPGSLELSAKVLSIQPGRLGAPWIVHWSRDGVDHSEPVSSVILALPPHALSPLVIGGTQQHPLASLSSMVSPSVSSVFLGFRREQIAHPLNGFGALFPSSELSTALGVLFSSSLFPNRAPADHVALTVLAGGVRRPDLAHLPDDALVERLLGDLKPLLGVEGMPLFVKRHTWAHAIPQYNLGHEAHQEVIATTEHAHDGLFIGGQVCQGISLPQCLLSGLHLAERALG